MWSPISPSPAWRSSPGGEDPADHDIVHALGNPIVIFGEIPDHFC
jgi:hypothetical protein